MWTYVGTNELYHHGTKGQKWGIRRYQNEDGSLTEEGRERYLNGSKKLTKEERKYKDEIEKNLSSSNNGDYDAFMKANEERAHRARKSALIKGIIGSTVVTAVSVAGNIRSIKNFTRLLEKMPDE